MKIWSGAIETRFQKAGDAGTSKDGTDPTSAAADASKPAAAPAVAPASSALRPAAAPVAPREAPPAAAPSAVRGANVQQQPPKLSAKGAISRPPQNGRSSALFTAAITATAKGGGGGGGDGRGSGSGSGSHGAPPAAKANLLAHNLLAHLRSPKAPPEPRPPLPLVMPRPQPRPPPMRLRLHLPLPLPLSAHQRPTECGRSMRALAPNRRAFLISGARSGGETGGNTEHAEQLTGTCCLMVSPAARRGSQRRTRSTAQHLGTSQFRCRQSS